MSESSSPAAAAHVTDATLMQQFERACGELQMAGRRLQRQTLDYQIVLDEIHRLEKMGTSQARERLDRLDALLNSEAFQRESREIERMCHALAGVVGRLNAEMPAETGNRQVTSVSTPVRSPAVRRACA